MQEPVPTVCWACGVVTTAITRHHVRSRRYGGSNDLSNLLPLCRDCHDIVDTTGYFKVEDLERIDRHPRLQTLLLARMLGDVYAVLSPVRLEEHVLKAAVRALENPDQPELLVVLKKSLTELQVLKGREEERRALEQWRETPPLPSKPGLKGGL